MDLETLLTKARAKAQGGKLDAAVALYRKVLELDPAHLDTHVFLARDFRRRGDLRRAVLHGELAVAAAPTDLSLQELLGSFLLAMIERGTAEAELTAVCEELPGAYISQLYLARQHEMRGDARAALLGYLRAINAARAAGFWWAAASTPPWLRKPVEHALEVATKGRAALFHDWLGSMHERHGRAEMRRVAECVAMFLGIKPIAYADPRQKPTFLYFPGLPSTPIFERADLPFADWYEAQTEAIHAEMLAVLQADRGVQAFHHAVPEELRGKLTQGGSWDAYFFYSSGARFDRHHDACPKTSAVLDQLPLDRVREHGPEVCFSILRPGAIILPHRGVTNTRSVLHLGLDIPRDCVLRLTGVGEQTWERGRCFAFDDTYEHEAWNRSAATRVVLLGDIWNPHLRAPERDAVADLVGFIGDLNRSTRPAPPAAAGAAPAAPAPR